MDVADWLRTLGLERYEAAFRENDVNAELLPYLTADDLKDLGVGSVGHRRLLLKAIAALRPKATPVDDRPSTRPTEYLDSPETTAERRPLSVMFCDLVGSTALSSRLDPEDLREVISAYQACVAATIRQFGGFIARYVGDGVLIYFGWPEARETDAERAVRAGLAIADTVSATYAGGEPLQVRIGIATGLVLVGELIGSGESRQHTAIGETPNLAARLQGLAEPNQVVIDAGTRRQIGGLFECQCLGSVELKGLPGSVPAWQVLGEGILESRFEALRGSTMMPLIGREEELELLLRRWKQAAAGEGRVVLLTGEPGIGKSRLFVELERRLATAAHTSLRYFCSPLHQDSALHPIIARWEQDSGFTRGDSAEQRLRKLESSLAPDDLSPVDIALLANMLGVPTDERYPLPEISPQQRKEQTYDVLGRRLTSLAQRQPVLMLVEDAHWADHSSLEVFDTLIDQIAELAILLVISFRPEFVPSWIGRPGVSLITLTRLDRGQSAALAVQVTTSQLLTQAILERIIAQTDGVPLFIEELTKTILETTPAGSPVALAVPSTLQASLMARLDRLPAARQVAQIGAVIGREFSYTLLIAAARLSELQLTTGLEELVSAGLVFRHGVPPETSYTFKHALVQDVAYESLLKTRRQQVHRQIAETLRDQLPDQADLEPEIVAHHFTQAGLPAHAVEWWSKAGSRAIQRSANVEASRYLRTALDSAEAMPAGPERARLEAELLVSLGVALTATTGYSSDEVGQIFDRARELCRGLDTPASLFPVLHGRYSHVQVGGDIATAQVLGESFLSLAEQQGHDEAIMVGHRMVGASRLMTGRFAEAREHPERVCALYDPERHSVLAYRYGQDVRIVACCYLVLALWHLGDLEQASCLAVEAQADAEAMSHTNSLGLVYNYAGSILQALIPAPEAVRSSAERLAQVGAKHHLPLWSAVGRYFQGWALAESGDCPGGIAAMHEGLEAMLSIKVRQFRPIFLTWLAAAHGRNGEPDIGLGLLDEADQQARTGGEAWLVPEALRVRGELLLLAGRDNSSAGARCFEEALTLARRMGSTSLTTRVLASRARG